MSVKRQTIAAEDRVSETDKGAAPRRTPTSGGYARGEETRARIIKAALKVFGDEGYERASTRLIAREAGVTPPALQYYFDSKEGLHRACGEFIVETAETMLSAAQARAALVLAQPAPDAAIDALCDLLDALVDASLFTREVPEWARFSARVKSEEESPAGPLIQARISDPINDLVGRLIACATASPLDAQARLRASTILSQVTAFHVHRDSTLRALGWPDFNGPRRDAIKAVLRRHTKAALKAGGGD
jgi:AcrR family transcriptional regulator